MLLIENLFKNKLTYILLIFVIILYSRQTQIIVGIPEGLNYVLFILSVIILHSINSHYEKRKKEKKNGVLNFFVILFFSLFVTFIIKIPLNAMIIALKDDRVYKKDCEIINFISGRFDRVAFIMDNKKQTIGYKNTTHLTRREIIDNYLLSVEYNTSLMNMKVIKDFSLVKKR